jgi:hypothetical protein
VSLNINSLFRDFGGFLRLINACRISCGTGSGFGVFPKPPALQKKSYLKRLPTNLRFQLDLQLLFTNASVALVENGLDLETPQKQTAFDIILRTYLDQLDALEAQQDEIHRKQPRSSGLSQNTNPRPHPQLPNQSTLK